MNDQELTIEKETVRDCPILYQMRYRPCTETCMCWGWEIDKGWEHIVRDLSYVLEGINVLIYPKYRVRIEADQIKQKFGVLCFYYSVIIDQGPIRTWLQHVFTKIEDKLQICKANQWWKIWLRKAVFKLDNWLICSYSNPSRKQRVIRNMVDEITAQIIAEAEKRCENTCEDCGCQVGSSWSPRCETTGWIKILCQQCADKCGWNYKMDGKLMNNGKIIENVKNTIINSNS